MNKFGIMQISENLLRVIFMLSTIVAVTDCCSSRLLLLKEHTLQIVQQQQRLHNIKSADYDYNNEDYDQLQQQQHHQQQLEQQQQQQQQRIPQYVEIVNSELEFNKNYTDEHTRSSDDDNEEKSTETQIFGETIQLGNFGSDSFESLLGIFDAAAFETTTAATTPRTTTTMATSTVTAATMTTTTANVESTTTTTAETAETASTETTTIVRTTAEESTTLMAEEGTSTHSDSTSTIIVSVETVMEPSSTMPTTATAATTAASSLADGVESVMNELKSVRDLLSLPCSGQFLTEFCLNRGRCFRYPIGNDTIHSCICADGYIGERCESKSMNGSFVPSIAGARKQKILMARIVFSFPMLVALSVIYIMIGAAVVFKRPATPPPTAYISAKERFELLLPDDDAGEFIMMNSYPIAAGAAATYSAYAD
ncbi:protein gurken isoform X1 [Rhagoletis pomonella]|uniref:protein gurken isoform X1 n=1 Tax=Rhagoletis pomonella TaxID=28610 RepID=UPI001783CC5D|nr:protein gurken isoform X1 [Rhagoletis pomonella]